MKNFFSFLFLLILLTQNVISAEKKNPKRTAPSTEENSVIRIACSEPDTNAEVFINGKLRGECPIDVIVGEGLIKLEVIKNVDKYKNRVFSQEFKIGEKVIKKIEPVLMDALTDAGRKHEEEKVAALAEEAELNFWNEIVVKGKVEKVKDYLEKYPNGKYVQNANIVQNLITNEGKFIAQFPPGIWKKLETSEFFIKAPTSKPVRFKFTEKHVTETTIFETKHIIEKSPYKSKCSILSGNKSINHGSYVTENKIPETIKCGSLLYIGSNDNQNIRMLNLNSVSGSIFPIAINSKMSYSAHYSDGDLTKTCDVIEGVAASSLNAIFSGKAYKIKCEISNNNNFQISDTQSMLDEDYYFEDYGLLFSDIAIWNLNDDKFVIPYNGYKSTVNGSVIEYFDVAIE